MKIIFLKDHASTPKTLSVSKAFIAVAALMFMAFGGVMVFAGMQLAQTDDRVIEHYSRLAPYKLDQQITNEQEKLDDLKVFLSNNLAALSVRLGGLQAQVSRINAVEKRLAAAAKIDMSSFNFDQEPAQGGAESLALDVSAASLSDNILSMEGKLAEREAAIKSLGVSLSEIVLKEGQTPEGMPVKRGWISSNYGWRSSPVSGKRQFHKGVDIPARTGEPVIAVADGVVIKSEKQAAYGNVIEINHGDGVRTLYAHNSKNLVSVGASVSKGDKIAEVGSTGRSTGPHVHFQVFKNGRVVNPKPFLR